LLIGKVVDDTADPTTVVDLYDGLDGNSDSFPAFKKMRHGEDKGIKNL
jgi:hypothetical protein